MTYLIATDPHPTTPVCPSVHLSKGELLAIRRATHVMLDVSAYRDFDAWRAAVVKETAVAVGADSGMFVIRADDAHTTIVNQDVARTDEYVPRTKDFDMRIRLWRRQLELVVWSRALLWGRHLREMKRSAYYNEFVRAVRGFDTIGLTVPVGETGELANLNWFHGSERGTPFGDRGLAIVSLLEPAFRVGVTLALTAHGTQTTSVVNLAEPQPARTGVGSALATLTPRERRVIGLLARRRTNKEIAAELNIAPGTAKRHVENILNKAGLRSRRDIEPVMGLEG